jgi:hypothetical protein
VPVRWVRGVIDIVCKVNRMLEYCVELDIEYDSGICFVIGTTESYFIYYFFIMRIYMHFLEGSMVPKKIFFLCVVVVVGFI